MDCNWCAVCSTHFHSDHQASLYCSEKCRKADALACCAFHDCDHPDGSTHHDHLTFCHHHRPAIRIPTLPLMNINPKPPAEQQAHDQHQADEWMSFLQQQYNAQYNSHAAHTSTHRSPAADMHRASLPLLDGHFRSQPQQRPMQSSEQHFFQPTSDILATSYQQQHLLQDAWQPRQQKTGYRHTFQAIDDHRKVAFEEADNLHASLASLSISNKDNTKGCEQPCVVRKNKALPPPTLSPILPPTISNPASLSPTTSSSNSSATDVVSLTSSSSGEGREDLSHAWPTMDKFFFPDHCCRTSACNTTRAGAPYSQKAKPRPKNKNKNKNKKEFVSELPPPPKYMDAQRDASGNTALSASIWGTGWHQVEPLTASFVKTLQKSNLLWSGCEKEHPHTRYHQRQRRDSGHSHDHGCQHGNSGHPRLVHSHGNKGRSSKQWGNGKSSSDSSSSSSWSTVCSSRLPRSLQFID